MKKASTSTENHEQNPTALVSLQYTNRNVCELSSIRQFKNLTELDISSNLLRSGVPELLHLRYLKRLTFSDNGLTCVPDLPQTLEVLVLSHNFLQDLQLGNLQRLHTLDVANNHISSLTGLSALPSLKCLYMPQNQLEKLEGLELSTGLLELDVASNPINSIEGLHALGLNDSVAVLHMKDTPYYSDLRKELIFNTCITSPFNFEHLEDGLFCRRLDKLKEIKSSRFRRIIRTLRSEPEQSASPEWAQSRRTEQEPLEPKRKKFELKLVTADERKPLDKTSLGLSPTDEHAKSTETAPRRNTQTTPEHEDRAALELRLERLETKWWDHYEGSAESYLDDLIVHCLGQECSSSEKYELAVAAIKQHDNERRQLLQERQNHELEIARLKREAKAYRAQLKEKEVQLSLQSSEVPSHSDESQMYVLESKLLTEKRIRVKLMQELKQTQESYESLKEENEGLKAELAHVSKNFILKIRELESSQQLSSTESMFVESSSLLSVDLSHYKKVSDGSKVQINKQVGNYIEQLKAKNSKLLAKLKKLRAQRDKFHQMFTALGSMVSL
jgi:Leucine-rich repeat (LRR) protein